LEKYIAKSDINGDQMRKDYAEIHLGFLILYHSTLGYLIAFILSENTVSGLLFFVPILLHVAVSSLSISELHEKFTSKTSVKALSSLAPMAGVLVYMFELISQSLFVPIFGTAIGMFFYVGVRDSIPNGDKGRPLEYLLGILLYLGVVLLANTVF